VKRGKGEEVGEKGRVGECEIGEGGKGGGGVVKWGGKGEGEGGTGGE